MKYKILETKSSRWSGLLQGNSSAWLLVGALQLGIMAPIALANPGAMTETRRERAERVQSQDPDVRKVQESLREKVRGHWYEVSIVSFPDSLVLRGEVASEGGRQAVLSAARAAVTKPVKDELRLRPALGDDQIASQVRATLHKDFPSLSKRVQVEVKQGVVYLTGNVSSHREVDAILASILMHEGVENIESDISIAGRPYSARHVRTANR